ncbi:MAG: histidinol-phosphate transaminase [Dehalococcoidia bacterium]|nr:histidinol-phosphate transaminase [Dehalococcoidia bacterium]
MLCHTQTCRQCILGIKPYVPGKPIDEVKRELGIEDVVKLASNENPLGPSPMAIEAIQAAAKDVALYPDGSCYTLRRDLSARLGVEPGMLIFGAGGDEVIFHLALAFLNVGDETVQSQVTFSEYETTAKLMDCKICCVPVDGYNADIDEMLEQVTDKTKLFIITNPNNPTGTLTPLKKVEEVLNKLPPQCILLLDEAYYEYVDDLNYTRSIEWIKEGRNVLALRTFSKIYGLAGLRIGYGVAPESIIQVLERVRAPFNVNSLAQAAAIASLKDPDQVTRSREQNRRSKEYFYAELDGMGVSYTPTQANFLWVDTGTDCKKVFSELLKRGVIVRTGDIFGCPTHIRVSTGTDEQNTRFIGAFREALGR